MNYNLTETYQYVSGVELVELEVSSSLWFFFLFWRAERHPGVILRSLTREPHAVGVVLLPPRRALLHRDVDLRQHGALLDHLGLLALSVNKVIVRYVDLN